MLQVVFLRIVESEEETKCGGRNEYDDILRQFWRLR